MATGEHINHSWGESVHHDDDHAHHEEVAVTHTQSPAARFGKSLSDHGWDVVTSFAARQRREQPLPKADSEEVTMEDEDA